MRVLFLLTAAAAIAAAQTQTIEKVFSGITTAQTSTTLRNVGQSMHLLTVTFPAEIAQVTGLKVRIEAAYTTAGPWLPISSDVTTVPLLAGKVYAIVPAYGSFPYLRVRSINGTGGKAMHVYYTGSDAVITVTLQDDRYTL